MKPKNPFFLKFSFSIIILSFISISLAMLLPPTSASAAPAATYPACHFAQGSGSPDLIVTAMEADQGPQCMEAIESALEGYTLAETYNITFTSRYDVSYKVLDKPAELIFQIPERLQASDRVFRMIHVDKGKVTVLGDMDSSTETITFRHDKAGAYALVYRDVPSSMPPEGDDFDSLMFVTPGEVNIPQEDVIEIEQLPMESFIYHPYNENEVTLHHYIPDK